MDHPQNNAWLDHAAAARLATPHETVRLNVDGLRREYVLHRPAGWDGRAPLPLVLMFHGGGGTARVSIYATGWSDKADAERFLVVYPQATRKDPTRPPTFLRNPTFWNVGSGFGHAEKAGVDDVAYVRAALDHVAASMRVDETRIYASGFSNGAAMALRCGVEFGPRLAAIGAIAGHLWRRDTPPTRAAPLLYICGGADPIVPPAGGDVLSPWGKTHRLPAVADTVGTWARWCGCESAPRVLRDEDGLRHVRYEPNAGGAAVEWITLAQAGHVWPGGPLVLSEKITGPSCSRVNATNTLWDFFQRHVAAPTRWER